MTTDLAETVRAAQAGDDQAFRVVYRTVQPGLLRYLTVLVGADAEDVASETWLQIARDLRSFDGGPGFRAWAATIARNRAMDHLRHRRRRPATAVPVAALAVLPARDDTAEQAGDGIATETALALIATLPKTEAEAVLLRSVIGLDAESAARVLGKRPGAVRVAAHRGLRRLARMLEHDDPLRSAETGAGPARTVPNPRTAGQPVEPPTRPRTSP